eukprot:COSAG02_NODE_5811_length_4021_cov_7.199133_5_plen_65_part_00
MMYHHICVCTVHIGFCRTVPRLTPCSAFLIGRRVRALRMQMHVHVLACATRRRPARVRGGPARA